MTDVIIDHTEKEIDKAKALLDLESLEYIPPTLLTTKDVDIAAKIAEISVHQKAHARGEGYIKTRAQYINIVGLLKEELIALRQENETILAENRSRTEQALAEYQIAKTPKETILEAKEEALSSFVGSVSVPLELPELPTYAQVEAFNSGADKPLKVKRNLAGTVHHLWCYVTENIKAQYLEGALEVNDIVIVTFVDRDTNKPLALQKVYKSW